MVWCWCYDVCGNGLSAFYWRVDRALGMNFWEGMALGLIVTVGILFLSSKLKPKKTYWDIHKDAKYTPDASTPDYKGRK